MNLNIGYVIIREDVSPLPADNAFAGRGLLLGGSSSLCGRRNLILNFTQHNRSSCRNVKFYKTLSIELFHGVYLVRNLIVAAIFLVVRGELNNKFL